MRHRRHPHGRPQGDPPMSWRPLMSGIAATALAVAWPFPPAARPQATPWVAMAHAVGTFVAALETDTRQRAMVPFNDPERFNWHYVPRRRSGLPLKAMTEAERAAAHQLLRVALSAEGYRKAVDIMRLEDVLRHTEWLGLSRDPDHYAFSIFSLPQRMFPLDWRVEGHHLSLNDTLATDHAGAVTPAFMGANPAEVRTGALKGLRVLGREQDVAFELWHSLDAAQRQRTRIATASLGDIVSGPGRADRLRTPQGLPVAAMHAAQRNRLWRLLEAYLHTMRPDIAELYVRGIREAGMNQRHFAWAGGLQPGHAHDYRVHGPTVLIEDDNTQHDANRIHTVWHDLRNDFGLDLLHAHYESGRVRHPHQLAGPRHRPRRAAGECWAARGRVRVDHRDGCRRSPRCDGR
jgi:Protein of unknown function (DUF3500)